MCNLRALQYPCGHVDCLSQQPCHIGADFRNCPQTVTMKTQPMFFETETNVPTHAAGPAPHPSELVCPGMRREAPCTQPRIAPATHANRQHASAQVARGVQNVGEGDPWGDFLSIPTWIYADGEIIGTSTKPYRAFDYIIEICRKHYKVDEWRKTSPNQPVPQPSGTSQAPVAPARKYRRIAAADPKNIEHCGSTQSSQQVSVGSEQRETDAGTNRAAFAQYADDQNIFPGHNDLGTQFKGHPVPSPFYPPRNPGQFHQPFQAAGQEEAMSRYLLGPEEMNGTVGFIDILPGLNATQNEKGASSWPANGFEQNWVPPEDPLDLTGSWMSDPSLWEDSAEYLDGMSGCDDVGELR